MARNKLVLKNGLILEKYSDEGKYKCFDCDNGDLNEFFSQDVINFRSQLLSETYALYFNTNPETAIALVSFCNDSVTKRKFALEEVEDAIPLPEEKGRFSYFPAVKITRLGVDKEFQSHGIGSNLMDLIKYFFRMDNRTGCRLLTVDAYNNDITLNYYKRNDFKFFTENDERRDTRAMYYDLLSCNIDMSETVVS